MIYGNKPNIKESDKRSKSPEDEAAKI